MWETVLSVGGSLLGGLLGSDDADEARAQSQAQFEQQIALQREFAQNGIRWKVDDAKAAGIHPLYALGGSGATYSPINVINDSTRSGLDFGKMGQDIGQAIERMKTPPEKEETRMEKLALERAELENDLLRSKIARENAETSPGMPSGLPSAVPGQEHGMRRAGAFVVKPKEIPSTNPGIPQSEGGAVPGIQWERTPTGGFAPHPSKALGMDEMDITDLRALEWMWRHRIAPTFGGTQVAPPKEWLPPGYDSWRWNGWKQEWQPQSDAKDLEERLEREYRFRDKMEGLSDRIFGRR